MGAYVSGYLGEKAHFLTEEGEQMQLGCVCVCVCPSIHPFLYALASFQRLRFGGSDYNLPLFTLTTPCH